MSSIEIKDEILMNTEKILKTCTDFKKFVCRGQNLEISYDYIDFVNTDGKVVTTANVAYDSPAAFIVDLNKAAIEFAQASMRG